MNLKSIQHRYNFDNIFETCVALLPFSNVNTKFFIFCVYRSPKSDVKVFVSIFYDLMMELYISDFNYLMCGYINMLLNNIIKKSLSFLEFGVNNIINMSTRFISLKDVMFLMRSYLITLFDMLNFNLHLLLIMRTICIKPTDTFQMQILYTKE